MSNAERISRDITIGSSSIDQFDDDSKEILSNNAVETEVLPYLTLTSLSDEKCLEVIDLAREALNAIVNGGDAAGFDFTHLGGLDSMEEELTRIAGDDNHRETEEVRKLFCAAIFNQLKNEDQNGKQNMHHSRQQIYEAFFGYGKNISYGCGDLGDYLELLSVAGREGDTDDRCLRVLYDETILKGVSDSKNEFKEKMESSDSLAQLRFLPVFYSILLQCGDRGWAQPTKEKIQAAFDDLRMDEKVTPLVKMVVDSLTDDKILVGERAEDNILAEQTSLHKEFPFLPGYTKLTKIAPGFVGIVGEGLQIKDILNENGDSLTPTKKDLNDKFLLSTAHQPNIKGLIDKKLGLDLSEVAFRSQIQLLKFMTEADNGRFERLSSTLHNINHDVREKLLENFFLVSDFGEDFGDMLLDIAGSEEINVERFKDLLDNLEICRNSIIGIADAIYRDYDNGDFADSFVKASTERMTDAVAVFHEIANNHIAEADLGSFGKTRFDYNRAIEAFKYEADSLKMANGIIDSLKNGVKDSFAEIAISKPNKYTGRNEYTIYNFYSPNNGYMLVYTRPEGSGSYNPNIEYGKSGNYNTGVEASISMIVNPKNPFVLPNPFKPNKRALNAAKTEVEREAMDRAESWKNDRISVIRIDREGRSINMPANAPDREPLRDLGLVSVDLAAIGDEKDTPSRMVAELFSTGNKIRASRRKKNDFYLNHNPRYFNQSKYGTAEGFRALVYHTDSEFDNWRSVFRPNKKQESFTGIYKESKKKLGKKALATMTSGRRFSVYG